LSKKDSPYSEGKKTDTSRRKTQQPWKKGGKTSMEKRSPEKVCKIWGGGWTQASFQKGGNLSNERALNQEDGVRKKKLDPCRCIKKGGK